MQRYFVQGMVEAAERYGRSLGFEVRFDTTIPSGAPTCHFTMWKGDPGERRQWEEYTTQLDRKALQLARDGGERGTST